MTYEKICSFLIMAVTTIEPLSWHLFCKKLCYRMTGKKNGKLRYMFALVLFILFKNSLSDFFQDSTILGYLTNGIGMTLYYLYSVKIYGIDKKITICILSCFNILYAVLEYIYTFLLLIVLKIVNPDYAMQPNMFRVLSFAILYCGATLILYWLSNLKLEFLLTFKNHKILNMFICLLTIDILTFLIFSIFSGSRTEQVYNYGTMSAMIFELIIGVYAIHSMTQLVKHEREITENLHSANSQIQLLEKNNLCSDKAKKIVHDSNNHILSIGYLLKDGQFEKAYEYVRQIMPELDAARVGSPEKNGIYILLYRKQVEAEQLGVSFDYIVCVEDVKIQIMDVSTLIFNMADNAIEYCRSHNLGKNGVTYRIYVLNDLLCFECFNMCNEDIDTDDFGNFVTTKKDKENHGLGIGIMEECVAKYGGSLEPILTNGLFIITASFSRDYAIEFKHEETRITNSKSLDCAIQT